MEYDFNRLLEPLEFQNLARDIVQIRDGVIFESFKEGTDEGIDGLYRDKAKGKTVLQAKRYKDFNSLKRDLHEKEIPKVFDLKPDRYILAVSLDLSPAQKETLLSMFEGFIRDGKDLLTGKDLNNLLTSADYGQILIKYCKLWQAHGEVIRKIIHNELNFSVIKESEWQLEEAVRNQAYFVPTSIYYRCLSQLERSGVVIISGQPGAGKTTLARILSLYYLQCRAFEDFAWVDDVKSLQALKDDSRKQVFVLDDIWGQTFYDPHYHEREMRKLFDLLKRIQNDPDKILIITSREYIYHQALSRFSEEKRHLDKLRLVCQTEEYTKAERAEILFNHLYHSPLTWAYVRAIYYSAKRIIGLRDYNPRLIDQFLREKEQDFLDYSSREFCQLFIENIENPHRFWSDIFNALSSESKLLASIVFLATEQSYYAVTDELKKAYQRTVSKLTPPLQNVKVFEACLSELEKTVVRVREDEDYGQVVLFRTPAAKDYLEHYLQEHIYELGQVLVDGVCHLNQLLFLMDNDIAPLPDEIRQIGWKRIGDEFESWQFSHPLEPSDNYFMEDETDVEVSLLYRLDLIIELHKKAPGSQ